MSSIKPWIVKLGGSLASSPALSSWLRILSEYGGGRVIVVPGGGPFADAVRDTQHEWGFDDETAHHMALLAMVQYGLMLSAMSPRLLATDQPAQWQAALQSGRVAVWLPVPMALQDSTMEASWRMTSDSLALWLARRVQAECVILIKSVTVADADLDIEHMSRAGIVDALFAAYRPDCGCDIVCLGASDHQRLGEALRLDCYTGLPIMQ
jgi:aspartokinase-like uncharacterized kinase